MKIIGVHMDRCTGCRTCELYCGAERGCEGKTLLKAVQDNPAPQPRIRIEAKGGLAFPFQCRHCLKAPCLDACSTGALYRDENSGMVLFHEDLCIGCWNCVDACPYGAIYPSPENEIVIKCDRCLYMEKPVCVDVCPTKALEVVDLDEIEERLRKRRRHALEKMVGNADENIRFLA